jgi:hypothetical protein
MTKRVASRVHETVGSMRGFFYYAQANRKRTELEHPELSFAAIARRLAVEYKCFSKVELRKWENEANNDDTNFSALFEENLQNHHDSSISEEERPKKKKRTKKDPKAPKGALSSYMLFCQVTRSKLIEDNPNAKFSEIGKLLGEAWAALSAEEKKKYADKADAEKNRFKREQKEYEEVPV